MTQGGRVLGYRGIHDHDNYDPNEVLMFHIRGDDEDHTRALQVCLPGFENIGASPCIWRRGPLVLSGAVLDFTYFLTQSTGYIIFFFT